MNFSFVAGTTSPVLRPFLPSVGGGLLAAPTNVQIVLQAQDSQGQSVYSGTTNTYSVPAPNHQTLAWKSVAGATSYNIYRSVNKGAYSLYQSGVTPSAAATAYSNYVAGSTSYSYATNVDCAYQDTAATNCAPTVTAPANSSGHPSFTTNNGYTYKVAAVNGSGEGTMSTDCILPFIVGGKALMNGGVFNGTIVFGDTTAPLPSLLGNSTTARYDGTAYTGTGDNSQFLINPYSGAGACTWNLSTAGMNYMVIDTLCSVPGMYFNLSAELVGDSYIGSGPVSSTYATQSTTAWVRVKIPLVDLMTSTLSPDIGTYFSEYYKTTWATQVTGTTWFEWFFSVT